MSEILTFIAADARFVLPQDGNNLRNQEQNQQASVAIRGHHFQFFHRSLRNGAQEVTNQIRTAITNHPEDIRYIHDTVGKNQEEANQYQQKAATIFQEFIDLPSDAPVKLVAGQRGNLCGSCAIAEHCDTKYRGHWGGPKIPVTKRDDDNLNSFLKIAEQLGIDEENIQVIKEIVTFSDAEPEKVKSIITTAGIMKQVFANSSLQEWL